MLSSRPRARLVAIHLALVLALVLAFAGRVRAQTALPATAQPPAAAVPADAATAPAAQPSAPAAPAAAPTKPAEDNLAEELIPIGILILVIVLMVRRLPRVDVGHSAAFRRRRILNWLPLGLTYAFLYMGRYNLTVFKDAGGLTGAEFGQIFGWGSATYGLAFLLNGPLTDRWGGRATILISAAGSAVCNLLMGILYASHSGSLTSFGFLYCANMYFQSFGAVSIVKVNASWFHVRERGTFGGIFGILISLGLYFAFDWGYRISRAFELEWLFWIPAIVLVVFFGLSYLFVRDNPSDAGQRDFDPGDASSGDDGPRVRAWVVLKRMLTNPIIITIALIEMCSGFLRQSILTLYRDFAKGVSITDSFVYEHWGMVSCIAGVTGGMFAGLISDHVFQSRRAPVSAVLYAIMLIGAIAMAAILLVPLDGLHAVGIIIAFMSMAIIGVHGMLSGTASQDFGGRKNAGVAVGLIDGFVYLGSAAQSFFYGYTLPEKKTPEAADIHNWYAWPLAMIPVALIGLLLARRVWHARPEKAGGVAPAPKATT